MDNRVIVVIDGKYECDAVPEIEQSKQESHPSNTLGPQNVLCLSLLLSQALPPPILSSLFGIALEDADRSYILFTGFSQAWWESCAPYYT